MQGKYSLIRLVQLLEHLVNEGLLDEKVRYVMEAIDRHILFLVTSFSLLY
jgi:hypothetical protein